MNNEQNGGCGCLLLFIFFVMACNGTISPALFFVIVFVYLMFG